MSWLVGQVWPWMLLAWVLGAVVTTVSMTTRVTVEKWVELPAEPADPPFVHASEPAPTAVVEQPTPQPASASPFPSLPGSPGQRPWEAEELWSRPARIAEPAGGAHRFRPHEPDEWSEAASSWRSWAEEAVNGTASEAPADGDTRAVGREPRPIGLVPAPEEDPFPYARPVEASGYSTPNLPALRDERPVDPSGPAGTAPHERRTA
jgi:hypothetical protein